MERVDWLAVGGGLGAVFVEEEVDGGYGFLGGADGVGECFEGEGSAFELDVGDVGGVDHQLPHPTGEDIGGDAGVGGDACHQPGLGDTDLAAGEGVVPHPHRTAEFGFLDAAVGFGA